MSGIRSFASRSAARGRSSRRRPFTLATAFAFTFLAVSCSDPEPEKSTAEILAELEGRELSAAEVAEHEQVAQLLCRLDDAVLIEIWDRLSAQQLEFQDFVFGRECTGRNGLYAEQTGRFALNDE